MRRDTSIARGGEKTKKDTEWCPFCPQPRLAAIFEYAFKLGAKFMLESLTDHN